MKITNLTADEMEIKEGSAGGIIAGAVFDLAGILTAIFLRHLNPYVIWIGIGMVVLGICLILFASSLTLNANRKTGKITYQKKRIAGAQNSTFNIADVFRIETRKQWQMQDAPQQNDQPAAQQPVLVAQSVIVFRDGRELALDHQKTSSTTQIGSAVLMSGQGAESALAAQVAKFLGVPFEEIQPPNMSSGINIVGTGY